MASYNKINQFTADCLNGVHNFTSHVVKIVLSNTAVLATNATVSAITQITNGNGYTTGGATPAGPAVTTASGTAKLATSGDAQWTASGGSMASLRYAVLYNDTPTSPADPTICWWDYGSSIAPAVGETFTVDLDNTNGILQFA